MDSHWVKVRQLVSQRVLSNHLRDLHVQRQVADTVHRKHVRHVTRDLCASQRERIGSLQIDSSDRWVSTPRRSSLSATLRSRSVSSPILTHSPSPTPEPVYHGDDPEASSMMGHGGGDGNLLDMMVTTLQTMHRAERTRPSLYRRGPLPPRQLPPVPGTDSKGSGTGPHIRRQIHPVGEQDGSVAGSEYRASEPGGQLGVRNHSTQKQGGCEIATDTPNIPFVLERGETFVMTDTSQVLSLDAVAGSAAHTPEHHAPSISKATAAVGRQGGADRSHVMRAAHNVSVAGFMGPAGPCDKGVSVDFYDEDEQPNADVIVAFQWLGDEEEKKGEKKSYEGRAEEKTGGVQQQEAEEEEKEDLWKELKYCRYIRGYVFGKSSSS